MGEPTKIYFGFGIKMFLFFQLVGRIYALNGTNVTLLEKNCKLQGANAILQCSLANLILYVLRLSFSIVNLIIYLLMSAIPFFIANFIPYPS